MRGYGGCSAGFGSGARIHECNKRKHAHTNATRKLAHTNATRKHAHTNATKGSTLQATIHGQANLPEMLPTQVGNSVQFRCMSSLCIKHITWMKNDWNSTNDDERERGGERETETECCYLSRIR